MPSTTSAEPRSDWNSTRRSRTVSRSRGAVVVVVVVGVSGIALLGGDRRGIGAETEQRQRGVVEDLRPVGLREEVAVVVDIGQRLPVGAVARDIGHVGAPDQPIGAEAVVE